MNLLALQVAYFFSSRVSTSWEAESLSLKGALSSELVEPQTIVLPIPDGIPDDVPRLMLQSTVTGFRVTASKGRVDIFFNPKDMDSPINEQVDSFQVAASKVLDALLPVGNILTRIGCVAKLFLPKDSPAGVVSGLLKNAPEPLSEISVRLNVQRSVAGLLSNDISVVSAGSVVVDGEEIPGVIVDRDTNNAAGHQVIYTRESAVDYVSACYKGLRSELLVAVEGAVNG